MRYEDEDDGVWNPILDGDDYEDSWIVEDEDEYENFDWEDDDYGDEDEDDTFYSTP